jgi:hypothetical protein
MTKGRVQLRLSFVADAENRRSVSFSLFQI